MPERHERFPNLQILDHPLIRRKLARIRDVNTSPEDFRRLLNQVAGLMTFQVSRDFETRAVEIDTPLERSEGIELTKPVTLVPILRAGVGMTDGILALMPEARVGHIGIYRDEASLEAVPYYAKFPPDIAAGPVLVVDPMLATGGSAVHAVGELKRLRCADIRMICLVCAPEGVQQMLEHHSDVVVFTAALDRELNDKGYILPGLGDAGDRIFGTQ